MQPLLPEGFAMLEPFIDDWVLPDSRARSHRRQSTAYTDIERFYQAILPHAPAALALLSERQLGELTDAEERLLKLLLSLAEIGPAVEWYQSPQVLDGFPAEHFTLREQIPDNQAQSR